MTRQYAVPKLAKTRQLTDGTMQALSSDGKTVYTITNRAEGSWSCDCPAGSTGRPCYHVRTCQTRYAGFFRAPFRGARQPARATVNDLYAA